MKRYVCIDTETRLFSPGNMAPEIICLSWAEGNESGLMLAKDIDAWLEPLLDLAIEGKLQFVGQYIAYDFGCLLEHHPRLGPKIWATYDAGAVNDTRIREQLLDIHDGVLRFWQPTPGVLKAKNYSLGHVVLNRFKHELDKTTWRTGYSQFANVPLDQWPEGAKRYAIDDAVWTLRLFYDQSDRAKARFYDLPDSKQQAAMDFALRLTSAWGMRTDAERTVALRDSLMNENTVFKAQLVDAGLMRPKNKQGDLSKNMKAIRSLIEQTFPGEVPRTKKGAISTSSDTIKQCHHDALSVMVEFAANEKLLSTYIKYMEQGINMPIHARWDVLGAASGRTSCSKPNLQNQPRKEGLRDCFKAREGSLFIACDYDSQELRTLAQACLWINDQSSLATEYQKNPDYDPHTDWAAYRLGIDYEEAMRRKDARDKELKFHRQRGKIVNFGLPGGMGVKGLILYAKGMGTIIDENEAVEMKEHWLRMRPEMDNYFGHVRSVVGMVGSGSITQLGSNRVRGDCGYTDGCNTYFQGLAADASKCALYEVAKRCYNDPTSPLYGARPVNFVHDEIMLECPEEQAHDAAQELKAVMEKSMEWYTPDVPSRASPALMRHWSKDAEPVYKNGRLVPWEDRKWQLGSTKQSDALGSALKSQSQASGLLKTKTAGASKRSNRPAISLRPPA